MSVAAASFVAWIILIPGWHFFPAEDVDDLDDATRARTAAPTHSVPARVPADPIVLADDARHRVPVTLLMGGFDHETLESELQNWGPYADEFRAIEDVEVVRIGSGHWPQFSTPQRLAELMLAAIAR